MRITGALLPEVLVIEPAVHRDSRGFLYEIYNEPEFGATVAPARFVQDNFSRSHRNVVRGLHYQLHEPQGKLVRVTRGEIFDVAVDLRRSSSSFGRWTGIRLAAEPPRSVWVPPGFAHGFLALSEVADVEYKLTAPRVPSAERCIVWNDPDLAIAWPVAGEPVLSARDRDAPRFRAAEVYP